MASSKTESENTQDEHTISCSDRNERKAEKKKKKKVGKGVLKAKQDTC